MGSSAPADTPVGPAALNPSVPGVSQGPFPKQPNQPGTTGTLSVNPSGNPGGGMFSNLPGGTYSPMMSSVSGPSPLQLGPTPKGFTSTMTPAQQQAWNQAEMTGNPQTVNQEQIALMEQGVSPSTLGWSSALPQSVIDAENAGFPSTTGNTPTTGSTSTSGSTTGGSSPSSTTLQQLLASLGGTGYMPQNLSQLAGGL